MKNLLSLLLFYLTLTFLLSCASSTATKDQKEFSKPSPEKTSLTKKDSSSNTSPGFEQTTEIDTAIHQLQFNITNWQQIEENPFSTFAPLYFKHQSEDKYYLFSGLDKSYLKIKSNKLFTYLIELLEVRPSSNAKKRVMDNGSQILSFRNKVDGKFFQYHFKISETKDRIFFEGIWFPKGQQSIEASKTDFQDMSKEIKPAVRSKGFLKPTASFLNIYGLEQLHKKKPLKALSFFEKALRYDPDNPQYLINCGFVYQTKKLHGVGIEHFERNFPLVQKSAKLLSILAEMYESEYDYSTAVYYNEASLKLSPDDEEVTINLSDALWGSGLKEESLQTVEDLYNRKKTLRLGVYVAHTYVALGYYDKAQYILDEIRPLDSISKKFAETEIQNLYFQNKLDELTAKNVHYLMQFPKSSTLHYYQGLSYYSKKQFKQAKKYLEFAAISHESSDQINNLLSSISIILQKTKKFKQKNSRTLKLFHNTDDPKHSEETIHHAIYHVNEKSVEFKKGKKLYSTEYMLIEILDSIGLAHFQEMVFNYDPAWEKISFAHLNILNSRAKIKSRINPNQISVSNEVKHNELTGILHLHVPFKQLSIGDYISIIINRRSTDPYFTLPFMEHNSIKDFYVTKDVFTIFAEPATIGYEEYGQNERIELDEGLQWVAENLPPLPIEKHIPSYFEFGTGIQLSGDSDWKSIGNNYYKSIKGQLIYSLSVKEKSYEITDTIYNIGNKVNHTIEWVRGNIRYINNPFGIHSIVPNQALQTLNERFGDCKDQTLLLKELLQNIGVNSNLALVNLNRRVTPALAGIEQFDHMILHIPAQNDMEERYVDPTQKIGTNRKVPITLEDKNVLILDSLASQMKHIPILDIPNEHLVDIQRNVYVSNDTLIDFHDKIDFHGKFAVQLREKLEEYTKASQEKLITDWIQLNIPNISVTQLHIKNIYNFSKPVIIEARYASKHMLSKKAGSLQLSLYNFWAESFLKLPSAERQLPIKIPHDNHFNYYVKVKVAPEYEIKLKNSPEEFVQNYISFKHKLNNDRNQIIIDYDWTLHPVYALASEYPKIKKEWSQIFQYSSPIYEIKK